MNEQKKRDVTDKAEDMVRRGVRRAFAIFVKTGQVCEWSAKKGKFIPFRNSAVLRDPVFVRPIAIQAMLDRAVGENEVASALAAKGNAVIVQLEQDARKKGLDEGLELGIKKGLDKGLRIGRKVLLQLIQVQFGAVPEPIRERVETADEREIEAWSNRLDAGMPLDDVFATP